jgi:putative ABC transport system ATP-binding protein
MTPPASAPSIGTTTALRRAFQESPELRKGLGLTLLLAFVGTGMAIVVPIMIQQIIDSDVLGADEIDMAAVLQKGAIALGAMLVSALAGRAAVIRLAVASSTGLSDLRVFTFRHLHELSVLHVESERRGALVSRVTSDVDTIMHFMEWGGVGIIVGSAQVLLAVLVMLYYDWRLTLLVVAGVALYAVLLGWFQQILRRAHDRVRGRVADTLAALGEAIAGLPVIRAFAAEDSTIENVRATLDAQCDEEYRTAKLGAALFSSAEIFAGMLTASVIGVGVVLGAASGTSAGTLLAFLFLVNLLVEPVQMLVETLDQAQTAGAGLRRILGVIDTDSDVPDPGVGPVLPDGGLDVRFESVGFSYPTGEPALRDVTVHVDTGSRLAVVGETGSGKTTFAKLVTRLLDPTTGRVRVGGVAIDQVPFRDLRNKVAFVPQEGFLFDDSIAANVRYGKPGATDEEVSVAFRDLELEGWVDSLPNGVETRVGERGNQLSAGERQLVAMVRAWIASPDLLVLDEATSAVDPSLEVKLRRAIERLTSGRTSITIAHRLSTAEAADRVLVFDRGALVEQGDHDALLAAGGVYAALHADWERGTAE